MTFTVDEAASSVQNIAAVAGDVVAAIRAENEARAERDDFLTSLTDSLIGQPNPMTEKPHSATSAEKAAKEADGYKEREKALRDAECQRILAWAEYERAKLFARLSVVALEGAA